MKPGITNYQTRLSRIGVGLILGLAAIGCGEDDDGSTTTPPDFVTMEDYYLIDNGTCPPEDCGLNDPRLNDYRFGQLALDGQRNARGVSITGFSAPDGAPLLPEIRLGEMVGCHLDDPACSRETAALVGDELIGATLHIEVAHRNGFRVPWDIQIQSTAVDQSWNNLSSSLTRYMLTFGPPGETARQPLCRDDDKDGTGIELTALLLPGERYDPRNLAVLYDDNPDVWFNVACYGHALDKMMLMGYIPRVPEELDAHTIVEQRQATIKMITADFCGQGYSFTEPGTPRTARPGPSRRGVVQGRESRRPQVHLGIDELEAASGRVPGQLDRALEMLPGTSGLFLRAIHRPDVVVKERESEWMIGYPPGQRLGDRDKGKGMRVGLQPQAGYVDVASERLDRLAGHAHLQAEMRGSPQGLDRVHQDRRVLPAHDGPAMSEQRIDHQGPVAQGLGALRDAASHRDGLVVAPGRGERSDVVQFPVQRGDLTPRDGIFGRRQLGHQGVAVATIRQRRQLADHHDGPVQVVDVDLGEHFQGAGESAASAVEAHHAPVE